MQIAHVLRKLMLILLLFASVSLATTFNIALHLQKYIVAHEIGHAIGLLHQHSRADRDDYVHINWENIPKSSQYYFKRENASTFGVPYDYTSLMQYNMWVRIVIRGVDPSADQFKRQAN